MLPGDEVALQETLREQQKINIVGVGLHRDAADHVQGRIDVAEDLTGLARTDPHRPTLSRASPATAPPHRVGVTPPTSCMRCRL
jgi:hypothetical protein